MGRYALFLAVSGILGLPVSIQAFISQRCFGGDGGVQWNSLKVKYQPPFSGRYTLPLSVRDMSKSWQFLKAHEDFDKVSLYVYKDDPRLQLMYDGHDNVCGIRVAYVIDEIKKKTPAEKTFPYSYDDKPIFKRGSALGKDVYYTDVLFIHPDALKTGGPEKRVEAVGTGAYINIDGNTWTELPRQEKDVGNTNFKKQACFLGMGQHYFYNMDKNMRCEDHQPIFLLYDKGQLIGIGLIPFGTFDHKNGQHWFEDPQKNIISTIVPNAPECLANWVGTYGTTSLHIYFRRFNALNCVI